MARYTPDGGIGSAAAPTFKAPENRQRSDNTNINPTLTELRNRSDRTALSLLLNENRNRSDNYRIPTGSFKVLSNRQRSENGMFTVAETAVGRSGTPDADRWGDSWTNAAVGQTGVNHGADTSLRFDNNPTGEMRAFYEVDLTRYAGLTAAGTHSLRINLGNASAVAAVVATLSFGAQSGRWFTESTIVQTNQPATPSLFTLSQSVPANSAAGANFTLTITDAQMNGLLGKWALIVLTSPAATASALTAASRESAAPPVLSFTASR